MCFDRLDCLKLDALAIGYVDGWSLIDCVCGKQMMAVVCGMAVIGVAAGLYGAYLSYVFPELKGSHAAILSCFLLWILALGKDSLGSDQ